MTNFQKSLIVLSLVLATYSNASATSVPPAAPTVAATPAVVAPAPATPEAPTAIPAAPEAMPAAPAAVTTPAEATATPPAADAAVAAVVQPVLPEMPKADPAFTAKIVENFNNNHFEQLASMFTGDGTLVTLNDEKMDGATAKSKLETLKNILPGSKMSITVEQVKDIAPGVATLTGKLMTSTMDGKLLTGSVTGTIKYDDHEWKIAALHLASKDVAAHMAEQKIAAESNATMEIGGAGLVGLLIGFVLAGMFRKKPKMETQTPPMMSDDANRTQG
ncbi:MAG: hypothetical protein ACHP6I_03120 [Rickettsiales bacterium]